MVKYDPEIIRDFINRVTSSPAVRFKISGKVEHVVNGGGTLSKVLSDIQIKVIPEIVEKKDTYIEYKIYNQTNEALIMGSEYIEFYNGSSWDRIIIEGFVSLDVLPVVNSNSDQTYKLNLHRELYPYVPGKYRVFKTVYPESVWNDKNNRDKHAINIASEFYMEFT